jgi:hypothetical protein
MYSMIIKLYVTCVEEKKKRLRYGSCKVKREEGSFDTGEGLAACYVRKESVKRLDSTRVRKKKWSQTHWTMEQGMHAWSEYCVGCTNSTYKNLKNRAKYIHVCVY